MAVATPAPPRLRDPASQPIWEKVQAGERLSREDGLAPLRHRRPSRRGPHGRLRQVAGATATRSSSCSTATSTRPTYACSPAASVTSPARRARRAPSRTRSRTCSTMIKPGTREAHIVGGHHPGLALRVLRAVDRVHPRRAAGDADQGLHRGRDRLLLAALEDRAARGADPPQEGGAPLDARAAAPRSSPRGCQKLLHYTGKADADRWCEIHGIAHSLGIKTNATMLYGHVETMEERVDHLIRLRRAAGPVGRLHHLHPAVLPDRHHQARAAPDPADRRPADHRGVAAAARQLPAHRGLLGDARRGDRLARAPLRRVRRQRHARGREDRPHGPRGEPGRPRHASRSSG